jgi:hypothetical protein
MLIKKRKRLQVREAYAYRNNLPEISGGAKSLQFISSSEAIRLKKSEIALGLSAPSSVTVGPCIGLRANVFQVGLQNSNSNILFSSHCTDDALLQSKLKWSGRASRLQTSQDTALRGRLGISAKVDKTWMFKTQYIGNDLYGSETMAKPALIGTGDLSQTNSNRVENVKNGSLLGQIVSEFNEVDQISVKPNKKRIRSSLISAFIPVRRAGTESYHQVYFKQKEKDHCPLLFSHDGDLQNKNASLILSYPPVNSTDINEQRVVYTPSHKVQHLCSPSIGYRRTLVAYNFAGAIKCRPVKSVLRLGRAQQDDPLVPSSVEVYRERQNV